MLYSDFSISMWVKATEIISTQQRFIGDRDGSNEGVVIGVSSTGKFAGNYEDWKLKVYEVEVPLSPEGNPDPRRV